MRRIDVKDKTTPNAGTSLIEKIPKSYQGQKEKEGFQERQSLFKRAVLVTDLGEKIYLVFCGLWIHVFCGHGSIVLWPQGLHR